MDPGFPGAGRVLRELGNISNVKYIKPEGSLGWMSFTNYDNHDFVFLPAWQPGLYPELMRRLKPAKIVMVWTSPPAQSEFVPIELDYLKEITHLLDAGKIHALWLGSKEWLPLLKKGNRKVFHCPYPVTLPETYESRDRINPPEDVSLFGPLHPRKNVVTQAIAAQAAGCILHITDNSGANLINKINSNFSTHGWLPEEEYHKLIMSMDLGLQISIPGVESFSYVLWDHLSLDVPCLTSVEWAPTELRISKPMDPQAIIYRMQSPIVTQVTNGKWRHWAEDFAKKRNSQVLDILKTELDITI